MKELIFMGDSKVSLSGFPDEVKREIGYVLRFAQDGKTHYKAKAFKGYPGVVEIVSPHRKETYRAVYAYKIGARLYVLHAFQKKSKHGSETPKPDLDVIEARYKAAKRMEEDNV